MRRIWPAPFGTAIIAFAAVDIELVLKIPKFSIGSENPAMMTRPRGSRTSRTVRMAGTSAAMRWPAIRPAFLFEYCPSASQT